MLSAAFYGMWKRSILVAFLIASCSKDDRQPAPPPAAPSTAVPAGVPQTPPSNDTTAPAPVPDTTAPAPVPDTTPPPASVPSTVPPTTTPPVATTPPAPADDVATDVLAYDEPAVETVTAPVAGEPIADVGVFYDQLEPYGTWYDDPSYGWTFTPTTASYQPYSNGHWKYTANGMLWVSADPFGWATDHYGRWVYRNRWVWVPDTKWAPAWVSWRHGDGVVGWAPVGYSTASYVPDDDWHFVDATVILAPDVRTHYVRRDVHRYIERTEPIARYGRHDQVTWAVGPSEDWLRRNRVPVVRADIDLTASGRFDRNRHDEL